MKEWKIVLFTPSFVFKNIHFFKDVVIVPEILSKEYDMGFSILTRPNEESYIKKGSINVVISRGFFGDISYFLREKPDLIVMFHLHILTYFYVCIFKLLLGKTKIFIKMDGEYICKIHSPFLRSVAWFFFSLVDVVTIESKKWIDFLKNTYTKNKAKFFYLPNGYYKEDYPSYVYSKEEKEKLILTVGRLWTYQKNTELLLDILSEVLSNNTDYQACLIGSVESDFRPYIEKYFSEKPHLKEKIHFIWLIEDRQKLFEYYRRSSFFLLSSRFDITPNVYAEAWYFWNIIVTTEVGWSWDITDNGKSGCVFHEDNPIHAVEYMQSLIEIDALAPIWEKSTHYIQQAFDYMPHLRAIYQYLFTR